MHLIRAHALVSLFVCVCFYVCALIQIHASCIRYDFGLLIVRTKIGFRLRASALYGMALGLGFVWILGFGYG